VVIRACWKSCLWGQLFRQTLYNYRDFAQSGA